MRNQNNYGLFHAVISSGEPKFTRSFETADAAQPLTVEGKLRKRNCNGFSRFCFTLAGALHPYDTAATLGLISDELKNPALVPVLKMFREQLPKILERSLAASGFEIIASRLKSVCTADGFTLTVDFPTALSRLREEKIIARIAAAIDALRPETFWLIEANAKRQPKPDAVAETIYRAKAAMERALDSMKENTANADSHRGAAA